MIFEIVLRIDLHLALFYGYGDPAPSIGVHIKLNQIQTKTNLGHKPQWKKWHRIQNLLGNKQDERNFIRKLFYLCQSRAHPYI